MKRPVVFAVDVVAVVVFALIGRASHSENAFTGLWHTAWPFLIGLLAGWLCFFGNRWLHRPDGLIAGAVIACVTTWIGLVIRVLVHQGARMPFPIIATVMMVIIFVLWRWLASATPWVQRHTAESTGR